MQHILEFHGNMILNNMEAILSQLTYNSDVREISLDLSDVIFIDTAGMSILTAYLNYMHLISLREGRDVRFYTKPPNNASVHKYLQRMDFYNNIGIQLDEMFSRHSGEGHFKEVLIINSEQESNQVSDDLLKILKEHTQLDDAFLHILRYSVTEIAENIFHHATSPVGGVVCAQVYKNQNKVQISIVDTGRGIPANIRTISGCENYDDKTALEKAIQLRVTSTPERNSGQGLFFSSQITARNGGTFTIHSLNGSIVMKQSGVEKKDSPFWNGTAVVFELPINITTSIKDLMDIYAPPENDFNFIQEV